ncbi:hypothetical protein SAMN04488003_11236 [Loktanella fryxellensis]|uniref:PRC-barrel domain-containing protein n=1 Tax=Loktanella fryxellensis TaxID=245187 RepID=A0A1H8F5G1_9RHOB|nr:hypothetical protein [Loktanella fryxellensis]SEN26308.1 hypothetical protein SAMN04488003_11236 [Loktanella fryxellensis]
MRIALALTASLMATTALAQTEAVVAEPTPTDPMVVVEIVDATAVGSFGINADLIDDLDLRNTAGDKIGDVEGVYGPDVMTPDAILVDFDDDAVSGDDDERLVPLTAVTFDGSALVLADGTDVGGLPVMND